MAHFHGLPGNWEAVLVVGNLGEAARELKPVAPSRTTGERSKFNCGLQASCKHRACAAMSPYPPKCTAAAEKWLRFCISAEYGGTRVHDRGGS